jgi:uncharacterized repeat protein (TIGR01451 family)
MNLVVKSFIRYSSLCSLISLGLLSYLLPAQAEGSRNLYPAGATGFRANLEWRTSRYGPISPINNSLKRRTLLQVYAKQGEYILMGSSAIGSGLADIQIDGTKTGRIGDETLSNSLFRCSTQRTATGNNNQGRIPNRAQELAGPDTITNAVTATPGTTITNGYIPCYYQAPSSGIYYVVVTGSSGDNSDAQNTPAGEISPANGSNFSNTQNTNIAAWDITVRNSLTSTTDINGRLFTDYVALFTGDNGRPINSSLYIATPDGYRYRTDLNGLDPNGFVLYGNDVGFYNSDGITPLYRDVLGDTSLLTNLVGGTNLALPTHKIFFNNPMTNVGAIDTLMAVGFSLTTITPTASNASFVGTVSESTTQQNNGGNFKFDSNVSGSYEIIISRNGTDFDPANPQNRVLRGQMPVSGTQAVTWDGKDNSGNFFPVGANYQTQLKTRNGEYHFPLLDAENSIKGGPIFTLLNSPSASQTIGYYDDRGYTTLGGANVGTPGQVLCGGSPPNPPQALAGFDTTSIQRKFGTTTGGGSASSCSGSFGDMKGLDVWTYAASNPTTTSFDIVQSPLRVSKTVQLIDIDNSGGATPGDSLEYVIEVLNTSSTILVNGVILSDPIPANTSYIPATLQVFAGANSGAKSDTNGDDQAEFTSSQVVFRLGTGANNTTGGTLGITPSDNSTVVKFRVRIDQPLPAGTAQVSNQAIVVSTGFPNTLSNDPGTPTPGDPTIVPIRPRLRLVKRITGIKKVGSTTVVPIGGYNDLAIDTNDDPSVNWIGGSNTYLSGAINGTQIPTPNPGLPEPQDEVEYTIYFLSDSSVSANNVNLCDFIPANQTFVSGSIQLSFNGTLGAIADVSGTGSGSGYYTSAFPADCTGMNNGRGAVRLQIGTVTSTPITPATSQGFFRFRAKVD